jgi:hypothetical protein
VVATSDVQQLQKKRQLQNQNVGDCLRPYSSVIASIGSQLPLTCVWKKKKKITEPVCDCNYLASVIATRSYVCCKWKPDFVCVLAKLLGCLEYDCKPG